MQNNKNLYHTKFVNVHPTGNLIQPSNKQIVFPVQLELLNTYMSDETSAYNIAVFVYSRDFLPMPICYSPVLLYIIKLPWTPTYTDSISTINIMRSIIVCYSTKTVFWYEQNKKMIDDAINIYDNNISLLEDKCFKTWKSIIMDFKDNKKNEKDTLETFIKFMENITLERIRIMEKCILMMFGLHKVIDYLYTPECFPDATKLKKEEQDKIIQSLCRFFRSKQDIRNERLQKLSNENKKDIQYFDLNDMETRLKKLSKDQIYKNYMDRLTAIEYLKFLDTEQILK